MEDSHNDRIRRVNRSAGIITTVAGSGETGYDGDDKPALQAALFTPSAIAAAPNGDIYIADMQHNRIRKVDAKTDVITTIAGSGIWGYSGDDGPATQARLAGQAGVAVAPEPDGTVMIFIADYYNGHVRAVADGIIRDLSGAGKASFGAPTRVAYAQSGPRRGWLYVTDSNQNKIVPLLVPRIAPSLVRRPVRAFGGRRMGE